jgi:CspA family cold shock protein
MAEGQIKWYSEKKGYGFIETDQDGDLFVHRSNIKEFGYFGFQTGDHVSFEIKDTRQGQQAVNVRPVKAFE